MPSLPLLLALLNAPASAFPGTFVAPEGEAPEVEAAWLVVARQGDRTVLTVAPRLDVPNTNPVAMVLPLPTGDVHHVENVPPSYLERVEAFAAPRLGRITCDDLLEVTYHPTAPGCGSFEPEPPAPPVGPQATAHMTLETTWGLGEWSAKLVKVDETRDELQEWLDTQGFALPEGATGFLEDWNWFLVATLTRNEGEMLQPLQVAYRDPDFVLPIRPGGATDTVQELVVVTITEANQGAVLVDNYPRAVIPDECQLEPDAFVEHYEKALDDALLTEPAPSWILEYVGNPGHCDPCLGDPLKPYELADFGFQGDPSEATVGRFRMRYRAEQLHDELQLKLVEHPPTQTRYIERLREIEFAYPVCGEGFVQDAGVCENLVLPDTSSGCATGSGPAGLLAVGLAVVAIRRRRAAPLVLLAAVMVPRAAHAEGSDDEPVQFELMGTVSAWSTDRVRFDAYDRGGPHLLMPMLGIEARVPIANVGSGRLGLTGGVRGFAGNATPGEIDMPVDFLFLEPHAGADLRWGRPSGRVAPTGRVGLQAAFAMLDSTAWTPHTSFSAWLHGSAGVYIGSGDTPFLLEVQTTLVPRTDGWGMQFDPVVRMPDWIFYAGSLDVALVAGVAFR